MVDDLFMCFCINIFLIYFKNFKIDVVEDCIEYNIVVFYMYFLFIIIVFVYVKEG